MLIWVSSETQLQRFINCIVYLVLPGTTKQRSVHTPRQGLITMEAVGLNHLCPIKSCASELDELVSQFARNSATASASTIDVQ